MMTWLLLAACSMGPSAETLIDELRVVAIRAEPPEAAPGESVSLSVTVADPQARGFDTLLWTCTLAGESCAESAGYSNGVWDGLVLSPAAETYAVPSAFSSFLTEEPLPLVQVWALSCEPGLCPPIEAARDLSTADAPQLQGWLTDPTSFLADLPLEGVSLGLRSVLLSTRSEGERVRNPAVTCTLDGDDPLVAEAGGELLFTCALEGDITDRSSVWGYATGGGWEGATVALEAGDAEVSYRWFAPEEAGPVEIWVVAVDGAGGVGLWSAVVAVE